MTADEIFDKTADWARQFDPDFAAMLEADPAYAKAIFSIGRGGKKPRKDFATLREVKPFIGFFYDPLFRVEERIPEKYDRDDIRRVYDAFTASFDPADDMDTWFGKIRQIGEDLGYTPDMKAYKASPDAFKGNVGDVSMFLRIAVTGRMNSPDMYAVMQILGADRVKARIEAMKASL